MYATPDLMGGPIPCLTFHMNEAIESFLFSSVQSFLLEVPGPVLGIKRRVPACKACVSAFFPYHF